MLLRSANTQAGSDPGGGGGGGVTGGGEATGGGVVRIRRGRGVNITVHLLCETLSGMIAPVHPVF
jgi:hypothetical protein